MALQIKVFRHNEINGFKICFYDRSADSANPVMTLTSQDPKMADFIGKPFEMTALQGTIYPIDIPSLI